MFPLTRVPLWYRFRSHVGDVRQVQLSTHSLSEYPGAALRDGLQREEVTEKFLFFSPRNRAGVNFTPG